MEQAPTSKRLVKVILHADLVRRMDRRILASGGAYEDRAEFIAEAILDRLTEEEALLEPGAAVHERASSRGHHRSAAGGQGSHTRRLTDTPPEIGANGPLLDTTLELGCWRDRGPLPVVRMSPTNRVNFGLHNRDLPTLWALDRLVGMIGEKHEPQPWEAFLDRLRGEGSRAGALLRQHDLAAPKILAVGTGFPKPGAKQASSVERFISAAVGNNRRGDGPFFVLGLAGFTNPERTRIAPSEPGLQVLGDMLQHGFGLSLPQPEAAFHDWWRFIAERAPAEHAAWRKVLAVVASEPTREELVFRFPEWPGNVAATNTVGFISRSREWGLVEPELADERYRLTELGRAVAREE
jgi:hypothetical protein